MISGCHFSIKHGEACFRPDEIFNPQYHDGDREFLSHLWISGNLDKLIEGECVLFRPQDLGYAQNWVTETKHVPEDNKPRLLFVLRRMEGDLSLWLKINKKERPISESINIPTR